MSPASLSASGQPRAPDGRNGTPARPAPTVSVARLPRLTRDAVILQKVQLLPYPFYTSYSSTATCKGEKAGQSLHCENEGQCHPRDGVTADDE